jgi:hypothetical protein
MTKFWIACYYGIMFFVNAITAFLIIQHYNLLSLDSQFNLPILEWGEKGQVGEKNQ